MSIRAARNEFEPCTGFPKWPCCRQVFAHSVQGSWVRCQPNDLFMGSLWLYHIGPMVCWAWADRWPWLLCISRQKRRMWPEMVTLCCKYVTCFSEMHKALAPIQIGVPGTWVLAMQGLNWRWKLRRREGRRLLFFLFKYFITQILETKSESAKVCVLRCQARNICQQ